jgi:hypothetical protein
MAKEINYSAPFILDTVFKEASSRDPVTGEAQGPIEERKGELAIMWDDIISLQSYPYDDKEVWNIHQGPKFFISLSEQGTHLCMGEFKKMFALWKAFKLKYYALDGQDTEGE